MTLAAPLSFARLRAGAASRRLPMGLILAACAGFMFLDLRSAPIVLWDESRTVVNALEMHLSGRLRLVTTYGFQPDLWNTKPPLLIWLMDLSMTVFGRPEWALRLPSMASALGVLALVTSFTRRITRSLATGALAAALLTLSITFFGEQGARTADYDALLCFLTCAYLYILFFALHRRRPKALAVLTAGALVGLAVLTKSIAGLLPGLGVAAYLLLVGRWRRPFQSPWYACAAVVGAAPVAAFFALREQAGPGYLKAALFNDVSGRFNSALDRHGGTPLYYLSALFRDGAFSGGLFVLPAPLALLRVRGAARLGMLYCLCVVVAILAVLSASATKLTHYALPALPFLSIFCAVAVREGVAALGRANAAGRLQLLTPRVATIALAAAMALVAARSAYFKLAYLPTREFYPQALYGELFRSLAARGLNTPQVMDGGVVGPDIVAEGVPHDYAPQLDFYRLLANAGGMKVRRASPGELDRGPAGELLASCDPAYAARLAAMAPDLGGVKGCVAVRRPARP